MSNTIYLPQAGKGIGAALGEGMSTGMIKQMDRQEKAEKAKRLGGLMQQMADAPDRKTALEMAGVLISQGAEDIADVSTIYAHVDRLHPPGDDVPVPVTAVGPDNKEITRFLPKGQTPRLNTPQGMADTFGAGSYLGKPEDELEFLRPPMPDSHLSSSPEAGNPPTSLGKFPVSKRPEGAISTPEYQMGRQLAQDKASIVSQDLARQAAVRGDNRDARAEEHLRLAQEREDRIAAEAKKTKGDAGARQDADDLRQDLSKLEGAVARSLGKQLADGTWTFEGENERKLFYERLKAGGDLLEKAYKSGGSRNYLGIADSVVKQFPGRADAPVEPTPPKPAAKKEPGLGEKVNEAAGKVNRALGLSKTELPTVKSDEDFAKVEPGQEFLDQNGKRWRKPKPKGKK